VREKRGEVNEREREAGRKNEMVRAKRERVRKRERKRSNEKDVSLITTASEQLSDARILL
jgi:hypothetical protein